MSKKILKNILQEFMEKIYIQGREAWHIWTVKTDLGIDVQTDRQTDKRTNKQTDKRRHRIFFHCSGSFVREQIIWPELPVQAVLTSVTSDCHWFWLWSPSLQIKIHQKNIYIYQKIQINRSHLDQERVCQSQTRTQLTYLYYLFICLLSEKMLSPV